MAILSNVNGKFAVDSTGAIQFSGSAGTSGYILRSNGNAAPTWVDSSTVIGGPYLPLTGGTLSGALAGTSATFSGNVTLNTNGTNFTHGYSGNGLVLSHHNVGPSNAIVSGNSVYPDNLYINNGGAASDWSNVIIEGDVGIGTSTPDAKLHIYGSSTVSEMYLGEDAAVDKAGILKYNQGNGTGTGSVQLGNYGDSLNTTGVTIKKGGNVGIGTSSPANKLHIIANTAGIEYDTGAGVRVDNAASSPDVSIMMAVSSANNIGIIQTLEPTVSWNTKDLAIQPRGGKVGIGTDTPAYKLDVSGGGIKLDGKCALTDNAYFVGAPTHGFRWNSNNDAYNNVIMYDNGNMHVRGNVGIGTTLPTNGKLEVQQTATTAGLFVQTGGTTSSYTIADFRTGTNLSALAIKGDGNSTFGGAITVGAGNSAFGGNLYIAKTTPQLILEGRGSGNSGAAVQFLGWAASNANWQLGNAIAGSGFQIRSSAVGGATFTTVAVIDGSSGVYTPTSDVNKKKDFEDSEIGLKEVMELQPKLFRMKTESEDTDKHLGFIAQEVKKVIPQAYLEENGENDEKFIGLQDRPIIAALTKAIQELKAEIDELKNK